MATDWSAINSKKEELFAQVPQETKEKYFGVSGIYGIYIEDELVYIGQSTNLLNRWIAHKINTRYNFQQKDYQEDKYQVFREAEKAGLRITCLVLEYCENNKYILNQKEREWIHNCQPILNGGFAAMIYYKGQKLIEKLSSNKIA